MIGVGLGVAAVAARQHAAAAPVATPATFTTAQLTTTGISADHTYQCDTETGSVFGVGKATIAIPVAVTAPGRIYARLRDKTSGAAVGPIGSYDVTTATTSLPFDVPGRLGWGYIDLSPDGSDWTTYAGSVSIGAGDQTLNSGQSLMDNFSSLSADLSASGLSSTDIAALTYCRIFQTNGTKSDLTGVTWDIPGSTKHPGPGAATYLSKMAQVRNRNQALSGHAVGGSDQASFQPTSGNSNWLQLVRVIGATGGKYRYVMWWQGHADAACAVLGKFYMHDANLRTFGVLVGTGAAGNGGYADLNSYVDPSGLTSRTGGVKYLTSSVNNLSYGPYYYGPTSWVTTVRKGSYDWTVATPGAVYVPMEGLDLSGVGGGVHPAGTGGFEAGKCWARAALSDNLGPKLISAVRETATTIVATFDVAVVVSGNWWTRFVPYVAGSTINKWPVSGGNTTGLPSTKVRLTLTNTPTDGDAFDLWLAPPYDGDPDYNEQPNMIRDTRTDGVDGANGRTFQPSLVAVPVAAINSATAVTPNASIPNYQAPISWHDFNFSTAPVYAAAELPDAVGFGRPLIGGIGAVPKNTVLSQNAPVGSASVGQTIVFRAKLPTATTTNNVTIFNIGGWSFNFSKGSGKVSAAFSTGQAVSMATVTLGKVYWFAATVTLSGTLLFYYKNVTDNTPVVLVTLALTKLYTPTNATIQVGAKNSTSPTPEAFFDSGAAALFDVGVFSEPIYTDVAANIVVPTAPLTGNEANLQYFWPMTYANDGGTGIQKNRVRIP